MLKASREPFFLKSKDLPFLVGAFLAHVIFLFSFGGFWAAMIDSYPQVDEGSVTLLLASFKSENESEKESLKKIEKEKGEKQISKRTALKKSTKKKGLDKSFAKGNQQGFEKNYMNIVQARLELFKTYPISSRRKREQGTTTLSFKVNVRGKVFSESVLKSSGYAALDIAALMALEKASPLPPIPDEINKKELAFTVPFEFSLF